MRLFFSLCLAAGCATPVFEPTVVTKTACTDDLQKAGDSVEISEVAGGWVEARVLRNGTVFAWGRTGPADGGMTEVRVRQVGAFTPVCTSLTEARAGHAAVKLNDGRVFFTGGFKATSGGSPLSLTSTELYDGTFTSNGPLTIASTLIPKARHTASLTPNGQILLYGGERYPTGGSAQPAPSSATLVWDAEQNAYGALAQRPTPPNIPRSRHVAVPTGDGGTLIAGGIRDGQLTPVAELELFDPATYRMTPGPSITGTVAGGAWVESLSKFALVTGATVALVTRDLMLSMSSAGLTTTRQFAHVRAHGSQLIIAGEGTTDIVDLSTGGVSAAPGLPSAVGSCSVPLTGGRLLVVSGRSATLLKPAWAAESFPDFTAPRSFATCTALDDGTVLVAGGEDPSGDALSDAFIFTPPLE